MIRRPPRSTLFPYTNALPIFPRIFNTRKWEASPVIPGAAVVSKSCFVERDEALWLVGKRSEEHTSELQSRSDLVCRLLLEKKKTITNIETNINHTHESQRLII